MYWYYVELTYATGKGRASLEPIKPKVGTYVTKVIADSKRSAVKKAKAQLNKQIERQAKKMPQKY